MKPVRLGGFSAGGGEPVFFVLGPCVIEDEKKTFFVLESLLETTSSIGAPFIFKASYDKANRSSVRSYRGPGLKKGLKILAKAKRLFGVPVLTDVHCAKDVAAVAEAVDVIQIPAFLSRQTDLITAAARSGRAINIKKGQFMAPEEIKNSIDKARSAGASPVTVTERGASFGYNNLVVDFRGIPVMRSFGCPVVFDATHSVQAPGGLGTSSGGDRAMARHLARAAVAVGVDGVFMEVHPDPERALCDGPNSIYLKDVPSILRELMDVDSLVKGMGYGA